MPLTTGSSSIFPSTSIPLWSFLAVFRPLLKGEILLQCWQSHGGPNPTPPPYTYGTELFESISTSRLPAAILMLRRIQWMPFLWCFDGLPRLYAHPISFSQPYQVTVLFQGLTRAFMVTLMIVEKLALEGVTDERIGHLFLCCNLLTQRRVCQRFQTNKRMVSKTPVIQIILTYFFLNDRERTGSIAKCAPKGFW